MKSKTTSYSVTGKFVMECEVIIEAQDWNDALEKAKELNELDFVTVSGQYIGGEYLGVQSMCKQ